MAMAFSDRGDDEDKPETATADEDMVDASKKWEGIRRRLVLVTAGRAGTGKSTLINNLLGLKGEKAALSKPGAKSVTKVVDYYDEEVRGIPVRIIDTPGLESMELRKEDDLALATVSELTEGKADLLLYCMSLAGRFDEKDDCIVKKLTRAFGKDIWKHAILVLTRGDSELTDEEEENRELLEGFTEMFEEALEKAGVSGVPVKSVLSIQNVCPKSESSALAMIQQPEIVGIPVGRSIKKTQGWALLLFKEIIRKCEVDAIPAILALQGITPDWLAKVYGFVSGGFVGYLIGVLLGGVIGAGVGAGIGALAGGVGAIPGGIAGAEIGAELGIYGASAVTIPTGILLGGMTGVQLAKELPGIAMLIKARETVKELKKKKKAN